MFDVILPSPCLIASKRSSSSIRNEWSPPGVKQVQQGCAFIWQPVQPLQKTDENRTAGLQRVNSMQVVRAVCHGALIGSCTCTGRRLYQHLRRIRCSQITVLIASQTWAFLAVLKPVGSSANVGSTRWLTLSCNAVGINMGQLFARMGMALSASLCEGLLSSISWAGGAQL